MLDKDTSLVTKIRMLFREQGITIASVFTAIRMAIRVLVEALLPGGGGTVATPPPPKDEKGVKECTTILQQCEENFFKVLGNSEALWQP